ncbi:MAG: FlgD immunoglobulin-like domain containing protein [Candidatus Eiseniibacteriota bacterium]
MAPALSSFRVPRTQSVAVRAFALLLTLAFAALPAAASDLVEVPQPVVRAFVDRDSRTAGASGPQATSNSNCPQAQCDTVWVGHSNTGPGGAFLGVGVGGVWDFDAGVAGTDSSQGFRRWALQYRPTGAVDPGLQAVAALDYGNAVNDGNTVLWNARDLAGRKYVKTGIAGAWHSDDMAGVKRNLADGAEPSALPIVGTRSAWCGLRESRNTAAVDALTGNYINGDLQIEQGVSSMAEFPGFCNGWDQMLYKDFPSGASGTVAFRFRTDLSTFIDPITGGSGWFNPDPTGFSNFVNNPADSFMVYVGAPRESGVYDTNRRWFSEVLDLSKPWQEVYAVSGKRPVVGADTSVTRPYSNLQPTGGNLRVVFRVKTNRVRSDQSTLSVSGFQSKDGAALVDAVQMNGGTVYGFESASSITARGLIPDLALDGGAWATTGRPVAAYFHIQDQGSVIYEDLCGGFGSPVRQCNLAGNFLVAGDRDIGNLIPIESTQLMESPTIDLAVRTAGPGTKNTQGIDRETALRTQVLLEFDVYSGFMGLEQSVFYRAGARSFAPTVWKSPVSAHPIWSDWYGTFIAGSPDPLCYRELRSLPAIGFPAGLADSLRVSVNVVTQGWRFGGTDLGNTRGTYFDNFRVGFVRSVSSASLTQDPWSKYQDQFPVNEAVTPGDNASFDTTTAYMRTALNIVAPSAAPGVVAGDSLVCFAPYLGDGITSGTRIDLIFRIDPGPANYTTKGNRTSALVNRDPAHPFFASYLANNGPFGTPGGHGGTWNRHVWNSARMDSAEMNLYPIVARGIGGPTPPAWMGTLHESEVGPAGARNALGISRSICFLLDPNGAVDISNIDCSGTVPPWAVAAGATSGSTVEGTKILPDGWFTPGTHVEYFLRWSRIEDPGNVTLLYDTTRVTLQGEGSPSGPDLDLDRWSSVDVLPDMWKSTRYGGAGLACVLLVDAADRRGAEPVYLGAADTMICRPLGKRNGAKKGWKGLGPGSDPNDPAGFVPANLGQAGLRFDLFEVSGAEFAEAGRPGARFASNGGAIAAKGDKSGPSTAMLATLYSTVVHFTGDLNEKTLHDGSDVQESSDDVALYQGFLEGATPISRRGLWLSGDGIMEDAVNFSISTDLYEFLTEFVGADLEAPSYHTKAGSGVTATTVGFLPVAPWNHPGRVYGFEHNCRVAADVLKVVPTVEGATEAAQYQAFGPGIWSASVYRPLDVGVREYRTLFDGFDLSHLRGHYANVSQIPTIPGTDIGRLAWMDDVFDSYFQICRGGGPCVLGDLPGVNGERFANVNLGARPNPALATDRIVLRFTLAEARDVSVRIYNVAGREVARIEHRGMPGENDVRWDGRLSSGAPAGPGVYFYRVEGVDFEAGSARQKLILIGRR